MSTPDSNQNTLSNLYHRGTHCLSMLFVLKSTDEDSRRKERLLLIILSVMIVLLTYFEISVLVQYSNLKERYTGIGIFPSLFFVIIFYCLFFLVHKGYRETVTYIFIFLYFTATLYASLVFGVSMPIGLLSYALLITMTSILISTSAGLILTGATFLGILIIGLRENTLNIIPAWKDHVVHIHNIIEYGTMLGLAAALSWLSNREIEKSLHRARVSEQLLAEERDNLEKTVEDRTKALQQAQYERMAQLTHFADFGKTSAGLFHDLLNPLTAVSLGIAKLGQHNDQKTQQEAKESVDIAIRATKKMEQYMASIRKRIVPTQFLQTFAIKKEIAEVLELNRFYAARHKVVYETRLDTDSMLYGDCLKFNQVINNLITNAIESYTKKSRVKHIVTVTAQEEGDTIIIAVSDKGKGISADEQYKIFNPFFTTKKDGLGLGLSTTKDIVEQDFHGTIMIQSTVDVGTTFTIKLPKHSHEQTATEGEHHRQEY